MHLIAEANGIEVRTPKTLRNTEELQKFTELKADVAVVAAYGLILPLPILEAYPFGCLNLHASLLPRWRGAAPIQRAIEAGDVKSGVTVMQVAEGLDTGDMLLKGEVEITSSTTGGELHDKLALQGAELISRILSYIKSFVPQPQPQDGACYAAKIDKAECKLDFNQKADVLCRKIRAFNPYPAMFFEYGGERFKVLEAHKAEKYAPAGTIIEDNNSLLIACTDGALNITQIQRQGKKLMTIGELLRGFHFAENSKAE